MTSKSNITLFFIFLFFFFVFASISFVNHYNFRTYLDLGMINHALYSFAHLKMDYFTLEVNGNMMNYFGDHFSPITLLYIPFYFLFGSYALLVIQILAILFGGLGVYYYAVQKKINGVSSYFFLLHFLGIWGIYSALSFDFHNNVVGTMFLPWMILKREQGKTKAMVLFFILMLISRENMALWLGFIFLGLLFQNIFEKKAFAKTDLYLMLISFSYFFIIVGFVMPFLSDSEKSAQIIRYGNIGNSISEIIITLIKNPRYTFSLFLENLNDEPIYSGIKSELHFMVLVSGGFIFFSRPYYFLMLLPIYAQKMLTHDVGFWGINAQYSIEFAPILSLAVIDFCARIQEEKWRRMTIMFVLLLTYYFTLETMNYRKSVWYDPIKTCFYNRSHYQTNISVLDAQKIFSKIPENASVSCSGLFSPHLAFRDKIYHFPIVKNADFIVLAHPSLNSSYPLSTKDFQNKVSNLRNDNAYQMVFDQSGLMVFQRLGFAPNSVLP